MRELQARFIDRARAVIEQVEIDRARTIAFMFRRPAEGGFDFPQFLQQLA